jgi:hypothetical protein
MKNQIKSFIYFILYLFIVNAIVLISALATGAQTLNIPKETEVFKTYMIIFVNLLPFHGIYSLVLFLVKLLIA